MSKRYDETIEVTPDPTGPEDTVRGPVAFRWRGRRYEIDQHLSSWREGAEWWHEQNARDRVCYRVLARPAGALATGELDADGFMTPSSVGSPAVYDLFLDRVTGAWKLARVWD